ncbi:MAG: basic amino acid ABC transporter substrate-binding protein [Mogibacterium sp.]|nr:basic amino acid ABC transporter substrate-binding protein [Mogibacterium sp.]
MKLKKLLVLALCLTTVFAFTACGGGGGEAEEEVMHVVAVTEPTYPPFESTDEDGNLVGFDIDLINAIAEDQGFEVEMQTMSFDALIPAVESNQADMIIAGISENPERAEHVAFTNPYYNSGNVFMVMADSPYNSEADFPADVKIAVQTGTTTMEYIQNMAADGKCAEPTILDQHSTCVLQLENGDVDAVAGDAPVLDEYVAKSPDKYKQIGPVSYETGDALLKMAVGKDNTELMEKLNTGLANLMENGKYQEICAKWGITPMQ